MSDWDSQKVRVIVIDGVMSGNMCGMVPDSQQHLDSVGCGLPRTPPSRRYGTIPYQYHTLPPWEATSFRIAFERAIAYISQHPRSHPNHRTAPFEQRM